MAKIISTDQFVPDQGINLLNPGAAVSAGEAMARAGESQKQAAGRLYNDAQQQEAKIAAAHAAFATFTINTRRAKNNAIVNASLTNAAKEFNNRVSERAKKQFDNYGQPTFDKLKEDVDVITSDIQRKHGTGLDEAQSTAFNANWNKFIADKTPSIFEEASRQQVQFSKASLSSSLAHAAEAATTDKFTNFPIYRNQVSDILRNAIADGTVSATEAEGMLAKFKTSVALPNINRMIVVDPARALTELANSAPDDLGLDAQQYGQALVSAQQNAIQKKVRDDKKAEVDANKQQKERETLTSIGVDQDIQNYKSGRVKDLTATKAAVMSDIMLPEDTKQRLLLDISKAEDQDLKDNQAITEILDLNGKGESLYKFSSGEIDNAFDKQVQAMEPKSLVEAADIAAKFQAPVTSYQKQLESSLLGPNDAKAADAAMAYDRVMKTGNVQVLKGMDSKAVEIANYAADLIKYNQEDPAMAMKHAKEAILNMNPEVRKILETEAYNMGVEEVGGYLQKATGGLNALPIIGMFLPDANIKITDQIEAEQLFRRNYVSQNGNPDAAARLTLQQMSNTYGKTGVTKAASGTVMRHPPEKVNPALGTEGVRAILSKILPPDVDVDNVTLSNYKLEDLGPNHPKGSKAYPVYQINEDGEEVPVIDPRTKSQKILIVPGAGK